MPDRLDKSIDQIALTYEFKNAEAEGRGHLRRLVPAAGSRPQGELTRASHGRRAVSAFVALDDVSHAYGGAGGTLAVEGLSIHVEPRRIRRGGRPVRLRQVHPDEARDRPAVPVQGNGAGRGRRS